jgi:preprotein translocase subunit SecG
MGGQSAFGTKAGDLFTRITIVVASIWVLLSLTTLGVLNGRSRTAGLNPNNRRSAPTVPAAPGGTSGTGAVAPPANADAKSPAAGETVPGTDAPNANSPAANTPAAKMPAGNVPAATGADAATPPAEPPPPAAPASADAKTDQP